MKTYRGIFHSDRMNFGTPTHQVRFNPATDLVYCYSKESVAFDPPTEADATSRTYRLNIQPAPITGYETVEIDGVPGLRAQFDLADDIDVTGLVTIPAPPPRGPVGYSGLEQIGGVCLFTHKATPMNPDCNLEVLTASGEWVTVTPSRNQRAAMSESQEA